MSRDTSTWMYPAEQQMPPLRPRLYGSKRAVSCEKPGHWLIRAWGPVWYDQPAKLVDWILHYTGRMDMADLVWWGYTYPGQPLYMLEHPAPLQAGLTIQHVLPPMTEFDRGHRYGQPLNLTIPERGVVQ